MICTPCQTAGKMLQLLSLEGEGLGAALKSLGLDGFNKSAVQELHLRCKGGTWCDCHHRLTGVNWQAMELESRPILEAV